MYNAPPHSIINILTVVGYINIYLFFINYILFSTEIEYISKEKMKLNNIKINNRAMLAATKFKVKSGLF